MSPGAVDADIERIPPRSPRRSAASSPATEFSPRASPSLTSSPSRSPGIVLTKEDGTRVRVPRSVLEAATIATAASPGSKFQKILIFDSGFGGLDMCVELALLGLCALIHIKGAHALFPKEALDDALRGHPGGSHLEMETTIKGIKFIAIGYKYNSKKSLFFLCAGGTGDGEYYVTKWPDSDGNILTRTRRETRPTSPKTVHHLQEKDHVLLHCGGLPGVRCVPSDRQPQRGSHGTRLLRRAPQTKRR